MLTFVLFLQSALGLLSTKRQDWARARSAPIRPQASTARRRSSTLLYSPDFSPLSQRRVHPRRLSTQRSASPHHHSYTLADMDDDPPVSEHHIAHQYQYHTILHHYQDQYHT